MIKKIIGIILLLLTLVSCEGGLVVVNGDYGGRRDFPRPIYCPPPPVIRPRPSMPLPPPRRNIIIARR